MRTLIVACFLTTFTNYCFAQNEKFAACNLVIKEGTTPITNLSICTNTSKTINVTGNGTSYTWSASSANVVFGSINNDTTTVSSTVAGTYTVTVTANSGCTGTNQATITLVVNALPTITSPPVAQTVCYGTNAAVSLIASGTNLSYQWQQAPACGGTFTNISNAITNSYTPPAITPVGSVFLQCIVTYTNNGCSETSSCVEYKVNALPVPTITANDASGIANDNTACYFNGTLQGNYTLVASPAGTYEWSGGSNATSGTIVPINNGVYTVTVTDGNGCIGSTSKNVTIQVANATITVTDNSGNVDNNLCSGQGNIILQANSNSSYAWSTIAITQNITIATGGTYTVTVTDSKGCTATDSQVITASTPPLNPTITPSETSGVSSNDGIICEGAPLTLTSSIASGYLWMPGASTSLAISPTPIGNTTYTVTINDLKGCTATDTQAIVVNQLPNAQITATDASGLANDDEIICINDNLTVTAAPSGINFTYSWSGPGLSGTVSPTTYAPTATGPISLTVTNTITNCPKTVQQAITVNSLPLLSDFVIIYSDISGINNNNGIVCWGDDIKFKSSPGLSASWLLNTNNYSGSTSIVYSVPLLAGTYPLQLTYQSSATGCYNTKTEEVAVIAECKVNKPADTAICAGTPLSFPAFTSPMLFDATDYEWTYTGAPIGEPADNNGNIPTFIPTNVGTTNLTGTFTVTPFNTLTLTSPPRNDKCYGTSKSFNITVYPSPVLNSPDIIYICDSVEFTYNATSSTSGTLISSWQRDNTLLGTGYGSLSGSPNGTSNSITNKLYNMTDNIVCVTYWDTIKIQGQGCSRLDSFEVCIYPSPKLEQNSDTVDTICSDSTIQFTVSTKTTMPVVNSSWERKVITGISQIGATGTGFTINELLTNSTDTIIFVPYYFTLELNGTGCNMQVDTVYVQVNPSPKVNLTNDTSYCNGALDNNGISFSSATPSSTINWSANGFFGQDTTMYPIGLDATGNIPQFSAANTNTTDTVITITLHAIANGCQGPDSTFTITVHPLPIPLITSTSNLFHPDTIVLCHGDTAILKLTDPNYTSWAWSTGATTDTLSINPPDGNTTYTVTVTSIDGCVSNDLIKVHVVKFPVLDKTGLDSVVLCDGDLIPFYTFKDSGGSAENIIYNWYNDNTTTGINMNGLNSFPQSIAVNAVNTNQTNALSQIKSNIYVIPYNYYTVGTNTLGCPGDSANIFNIKVNARPQLTNTDFDTTICSGDQLNFTLIPSFTNTVTYFWTFNDSTPIISGGVNSVFPYSTSTIIDILSHDSNSLVSYPTYSIWLLNTLDGKACSSDTSMYTIQVNPDPPALSFKEVAFPKYFNPNDSANTFIKDFEHICIGTQNVMVAPATPVGAGYVYTWATNFNDTAHIVANVDSSLVLFSFNSVTDSVSASVNNKSGTLKCAGALTPVSEIKPKGKTITNSRIILKQPGNLLVYLDHTMDGYMWGYDRIDTSYIDSDSNKVYRFNSPFLDATQMYQAFVPDKNAPYYDKVNDKLKTDEYGFWVLAYNKNEGETGAKEFCRTRVYYNTVIGTGRIEEVEVADGLQASIYPNPGNGDYELILSSTYTGMVTVTVYDALGKLIMQTTTNKEQEIERKRLDLQALGNGVYTLHVQASDGNSAFVKIVKQ